MALICTYFVSRLFLVFRVLFVPLQYKIEKNTRTMARNKKAPKAKEPIRLRMKDLSLSELSSLAKVTQTICLIEILCVFLWTNLTSDIRFVHYIQKKGTA